MSAAIGRYLIGMVGACVVASMAKMILSGSRHYKALGNTIVGIFLIFSILSPIVKIDWGADDFYNGNFAAEYDRVASDASAFQEDALRQSIKAKTEAYVWNKAKELSLDVNIEITLSEAYPYAPCGACISGPVSPYAKAQLSSYLSGEIGIPKEAQVWKSAKS